MSSEVDIVNMALSNLGDEATVSSINPPEGSAQAEHAKTYYPQARDSLLEMHTWNFATKRVRPSAITEGGEYTDSTQWDYAYPLPSDYLSLISVLNDESTDDYSASGYTPTPYQVEISGDGGKIIRTDEEDAEIRYIGRIVNTALYSHLFVLTLSWHLSSMLAGPLLKGEAGRTAALTSARTMEYFKKMAITADSKQRKINPKHHVSWIAGR